MTYLYLAFARLTWIVGTRALKASEEFTKLVPSIIVVTGYGLSFYFMTLVLRIIPIGITHAVWSGTGIVLIVVAGTIIYKQIPDIPAIIGMVLIILGVAVIHFFIKKPFIIKFDELVKRSYCSLNDHFGAFRVGDTKFQELIVTSSNSLKFLTYHLSKRFIPKCSKSFANDFLRVCQI